MDCIDCHNRPSHAIAATPERAVNDAMARGDIPTTLPFVHREAVKVLKASLCLTGGGGCGRFRAALRDFYRTQPAVAAARAPDIDQAVLGVAGSLSVGTCFRR